MVDLVPDKAIAIGASVVAKRGAEEGSFKVVGIIEANVRSALLVGGAHDAPTLQRNQELSNILNLCGTS